MLPLVPVLPLRHHVRIPRPPLSRFIDRLWLMEGVMPYARERVLPNGVLELIFNFGKYHKVVDERSPAESAVFKRCWVAGLQSRELTIEADHETDLLGVRFKPGGAYPFFSLPMAELVDQVVESDLLPGLWTREVRDRLLEAKAPEPRFDLIEGALVERLRRADAPSALAVDFAVRELRQTNGAASIRHLCERAGVTNKHMVDQFKKRVGLSPKLLGRVFRFQRVLDEVRGRRQVDWTEVAHTCGYYDQAHFNHEFKELSGSTPSGYLAHHTPDGEHIIVG
jgi:AraC-like DNA-binding protein